MSQAKYVFTPPPIESLLEACIGQSFWPAELALKTSFVQQIEMQQRLLYQLRQTFAALPLDLTIANGLTQGLVAESNVEYLFNALALQLESNEAQKRLVLYLPFELLTPITSASTKVQEASNRFRRAYRSAWESQLSQHEVRANYDNGDVLEPELLVGDHPRVVKAAHLVPGLLQVGHLTVHEVYEYLRLAHDPVLRDSLNDACIVAADLGLFPSSELMRHDRHISTTQTESSLTTEGRTRWLLSMKVDHEKQIAAKQIANILEREWHASHFVPDNTQLPIALEAVRIASLRNPAVLERHWDWLDAAASLKDTPDVEDSFAKLCSHLYARRLITLTDLEAWNVTIPHLAGPFADNVDRMTPPRSYIIDTCEQISLHPRLSQLVYPVALIFGSQIKGYGLREADCDVAVLVRPHVGRSERAYLEEALSQIYSHERFSGKVTLFWLTEKHGHLHVIDWPKLAYSDGESSWIHVLFGALWFGEKDSISMLHQQLLLPYFSSPTTLLMGKPVYERWLEEMERDSMQYRLLHKGFERFYPIESPVNTEHRNLIDGHAAFYDSRYRRIATELFVRRVWLPHT